MGSNMKISKYFGSGDLITPKYYWPSLTNRDRLYDWWEDHMRRIEDDFSRNRTTLMPLDTVYTPTSLFAPERRRRLFNTMFHDDYETRVVENRTHNEIEYHIPTGAGDFFKPGDLEVNVRGRDVEVRARREEKTDDGNSYVLREVRRVVRVPEGVDVDRVAADMRHSGKLIVKVPLDTPKIGYRSAWSPSYTRSTSLVPIKVNKLW